METSWFGAYKLNQCKKQKVDSKEFGWFEGGGWQTVGNIARDHRNKRLAGTETLSGQLRQVITKFSFSGTSRRQADLEPKLSLWPYVIPAGHSCRECPLLQPSCCQIPSESRQASSHPQASGTWSARSGSVLQSRQSFGRLFKNAQSKKCKKVSDKL
jgi:hypothetical protein